MKLHPLFGLAVAVAVLLGAPAASRAGADGPVSALRVAICALENRSDDPRLRKEDQGKFVADLIQQRIKQLPFVEVLPRPKAETLPPNADFVLRGDYLPQVTGRYRLDLRLLAHDGSVVATWSDEAPSWRAMTMDLRRLEPDERLMLAPEGREAPNDRRATATALADAVAQELQRHYTLRQLEQLHGKPGAVRASVTLQPKQQAYRTGERVAVCFSPEVDCHVVILQLRAGGRVRLACPSNAQEQDTVKAQADFATNPGALPVRLISPLPVEETRVRVILSRQPIDLPPALWNARTAEEQLKLVTALRDALSALPDGTWSDAVLPMRIVGQ